MASEDPVELTPPVQVPPCPENEAPSNIEEASESQSKPGPLTSLFEKAATSPLIQKVDQRLPSDVRPALSRGVTHTRKVLNGLDEAVVVARDALETNEGKELASASCAFAKSLVAFLRMLYASALLAVERRAGLELKDEDSLASRSVRIGRHVVSRASTTMNRREEQVSGTCEAQIYSYARYCMRLLFSLFAILLNSLATFNGAGASYISPAAKQVIDSLPDDVRKTVTEEGDIAGAFERIRHQSATDTSAGNEPS